MGKDKINSIQLISILIFIISAPLTGINLTYLFSSSGVDAYLCPIIAAIMGIPLIIIFIYIFNYKPEFSLSEKINYVFGSKWGLLINLLLILFALFFTTTMFFNLTDFIVSQFLPETPTKIVGIFFAIAIVYIVIKGIETLSRVSLILLFLVIIIFIISLLGLTSTFDIDNIKPFFEFGVSHTFKGALHLLYINYFPMFLLLAVPKKQITDNKNFNKYFIGAYIFSTILMFLIILLTIGNLGYNLSISYQYPEYIVLKKINLFNFLDRIENILSTQRIIKIFMFISFIVYFISTVFKKKLIPLVTVFFIFIISQNVFSNNTLFNNFLLKYNYLVRIAFLCLIIFIFIGLIIKKKHRDDT